jgi:type I restriction enzyme S subunit
MELKPGYKQTEVGVIPEDWGVARLANLLSSGPKNGYSGRSGKDARGTPTLALTATTSGQMILDDDTLKYLEKTLEVHSDILLKAGDVLVQRSNTLELVGTTAIFDGPSGVYAYPDLMMRLRFIAPETSRWFWRYANSSGGRRYFVSVAAGSTGTMPKLSGDRLRTMPLPLPPSPEQRAIATALSDVDGLLVGLDRLIAKKRDLKQAAMQQLLTGQIRLPGFHSEWEVKSVSQITLKIIDYRGRTPLKLGMDWGGGNIPALSARNVKMGYIDFEEEAYFASEALYKRWMTNGDAKKGDLLMTTEAPLGNVALIPDDRKYILSQRTILLQVNPEIALSHFLLQAMSGSAFQKLLSDNASGSTATGIQRKRLEKLEMSLPSVTEQTAIAEVLSDMDAELAALEQRREKTRALKQAMMQELLTGRTRLL